VFAHGQELAGALQALWSCSSSEDVFTAFRIGWVDIAVFVWSRAAFVERKGGEEGESVVPHDGGASFSFSVIGMHVRK
jgi:hypothetical protein